MTKNRYFNILVVVSLSIYVFGSVLGFLNSSLTLSESPNKYTISMDNIDFIEILRNNLYSLAIILMGALLLGIPTLMSLLYNGFVLGVITFYSIKLLKTNSYIIGLLILPHGIFEILAMIIAGVAGFKIPYEIVRYLAGKKEQPLTKEDIKEYLTFALISIILIVIAAWIEANVTLKIAQTMLNSTKGI